MPGAKRTRAAGVGYGAIGRPVPQVIQPQCDMALVGGADVFVGRRVAQVKRRTR